MLTEKVLPIFHPVSKTFPGLTNILSILNHSDEYLPWYFTNHVILSTYTDHVDFFVFFHHPIPIMYDCPWIEWQKISISLLKSLPEIDIIRFILTCLDNDHYVLIKINTKGNHFYSFIDEHDALISGYDYLNKEFVVSDFFRAGKYETYRIPFHLIDSGFKNNENKYPQNNYISLFKLVTYPYKFNIKDMTQSIKQYLIGELDHGGKPNEKYGVNIYPEIISYIELKIRENKNLDVRVFHVLFEHKKCMVDRMHFLQDKGYINYEEFIILSPCFIELMQISEAIRNLVLMKRYNAVIVRIDELMRKESMALERLLQVINDPN